MQAVKPVWEKEWGEDDPSVEKGNGAVDSWWEAVPSPSVLLGVGGWSQGSTGFSEQAALPFPCEFLIHIPKPLPWG